MTFFVFRDTYIYIYNTQALAPLTEYNQEYINSEEHQESFLSVPKLSVNL